ncbi:MAG: LamG domain-containing protein [Bacteroidota bacterium]
MSTLDTTLQLYLPLDNLSSDSSGTYVSDESQNANTGTLAGDPTLTADSYFSNSLALDGMEDFVSVANDPFTNPNEFTISIWANPSALNDGNSHALIGKEGDSFRKPSLWISAINSGLTYDSYDATGTQQFQSTIVNFFQNADEWVHIAWVKQGTEYLFYRNGDLIATLDAPENVYTAASSYQIGHVDTFWNGKVAHTRIYSRALTQNEIIYDRDEDLTSVAAFRRSHPISFEVMVNDQPNVLYITADPTQQTMLLNIANESKKDIALGTSSGTAGADMFHFALHFRPGTLSDDSFNNFALSADSLAAGWTSGTALQADGTRSLYFLNAGGATLAAGDALSFNLSNMSAATGTGTRNSRIELDYREEPDTTVSVSPTRSRTVQLDVVNYSGVADLSIHLGSVGSNTVLNDGVSETDLAFHLTNTNVVVDALFPERSQIRFTGNSETVYTKLVLIAETRTATQVGNGEKEWGLCAESLAANIQPFIEGFVLESSNLVGESPQWIFSTDSDVVLNSGEYLSIAVNNIKSDAPTGLTRLVLRYENVLGYADGMLTVPVMKSPLVIEEDHVGIAMPPTRAGLSIMCDYKVPLYMASTSNKGTWLELDSTGITNGREYSIISSGDGVDAGAGKLLFRDTTDQTVYMTIDYGGKIGVGNNHHDPEAWMHIKSPSKQLGITNALEHTWTIESQVDDRLHFGFTDLMDTNTEAMTLSSLGKMYVASQIGVANETPDSLLDIKGSGNQFGITNEANQSWTFTNWTDNALYFQHRINGVRQSNPMHLNTSGTLTVNQQFTVGSSHLNGTQLQVGGGATLSSSQLTIGSASLNSSHLTLGNSSLTSSKLTVNGSELTGSHLKIGSTTIYESQLKILKELAAGTLQVDLYNDDQGEYLYAADYHPYDDSRRRVFTWRDGNRVTQGRWTLKWPS